MALVYLLIKKNLDFLKHLIFNYYLWDQLPYFSYIILNFNKQLELYNTFYLIFERL